MQFPVPIDEDERLRALRSYGILDTPAEAAFDRISAFAARLFDVPVCLVSLIDRDRQYLKSCYGLDLKETPRSDAFCAHTILAPGEPLIVEDAAADARFARNPLVVGEPRIRFYAGMPLLAQRSSALGSLCLIDHQPRRFSAQDLENLRDLAAIVEDQIRLHERRQHARESEARFRALHEAVNASLEHLRETLMWMVPHELKTPLNGVLGFAELLRVSWKSIQPSQVDELIARLQDAGNRMERGVRNVCALTQLEIAANDPLARARLASQDELRIDALATSVAQAAAARYGRAGDLRLELEPGHVNAPADFLEKALDEALDNAFKFSPSGSPVSVQGRSAADDYLLAIEDRGPGMTADQIEQVGAFMQFGRDCFEQQGMGLGFALVRRIADIFGLTLRIAAREGGGLRVALRFPRH